MAGKKKKKQKSIGRVFLKYFLVLTMIFVIVFGGVVAGVFVGSANVDKDINLDKLSLSLTSVIYGEDSDGKTVEFEKLNGKENRIWVDFDKIPEEMKNAFVAIEDERFYSHNGVDIRRFTSAAINYVFKKGSQHGGSTITQQLIKNLTGDKDVKISRKLTEIIRAYTLERKVRDKDKILEAYLNTIYLGQGCNGVQLASNVYFNKDVSELNLAECAAIAGITQSPVYYDPFLNPENNKTKQETVLAKMLELGYITQQEHDDAVAYQLKFTKENMDKRAASQSYFADEVVNDLIDDLVNEKGYSKSQASNMVYNGGLKIYATVDPNVQSSMQSIFENSKNIPTIKGNGDDTPQSAMVVLDAQTGGVKGLIGGLGPKQESRSLNRATQTKRQPGSSIKPLSVYGPAIEEGLISPSTIFQDEKIDINGWTPKNHYTGFKGSMTVKAAIEQSTNTIAIKVLQLLGVDKSYDFLTDKLHFTTLVESSKREDGKVYSDKNLSALALGGMTDGVTVEEMTAGFLPFVNGGEYIRPYTYTKVEDKDGNVLIEKTPEKNRAIKENTAEVMTYLLQSGVTNGTGTPARLSSGMPAAGKTGTASNDTLGDTDRWFVGYTPYYVGGCWFGYDQQKSLDSLSSNPAVSLWKKVMDEIHKGKDVIKLKTDSGGPAGKNGDGTATAKPSASPSPDSTAAPSSEPTNKPPVSTTTAPPVSVTEENPPTQKPTQKPTPAKTPDVTVEVE